jgi:hypothetical protein
LLFYWGKAPACLRQAENLHFTVRNWRSPAKYLPDKRLACLCQAINLLSKRDKQLGFFLASRPLAKKTRQAVSCRDKHFACRFLPNGKRKQADLASEGKRAKYIYVCIQNV